jgi:hypothetical protein
MIFLRLNIQIARGQTLASKRGEYNTQVYWAGTQSREARAQDKIDLRSSSQPSIIHILSGKPCLLTSKCRKDPPELCKS